MHRFEGLCKNPQIEDLWPLFLAAYPALQVPSPLTRQAYTTLAPTLGPWLMTTQGLNTVTAQLALESMWACRVGLTGACAAYRFHALVAVLRSPCPRWAAPFEVAVGHDGVLFAYPELLAALQLEGDRAEILAETAEVLEAMARVHPWNITDADGVPHVAVSLNEVVDYLSPLSTLPACQTRWHWIRTAYAPAIAQHGYYEPARQHEPPPGQELDALEARENARELLNALLPGLGDETIAALEETETAPVGQELDMRTFREGMRVLFNSILPGLGDETLALDS
jgi:hypothetical protein